MNTPSQGPWPGRFVWHDMMTTDAERSASFYCSLFGWQFDERRMPGFVYRTILAGPGPIGGIMVSNASPFSSNAIFTFWTYGDSGCSCRTKDMPAHATVEAGRP